jgi:hypothetical protein
MNQEVLPAVAKNIFLDCKKCGSGRYHVVVAHKSSTSAKVQCEVCKTHRSYSISKKKTSPTSEKSSARAVRSSANSHQKEFEFLMDTHKESKGVPYNMKSKFEVNQKLDHPRFGVGIIRAVQSDKIEVVFSDEVKSLIHNRV